MSTTVQSLPVSGTFDTAHHEYKWERHGMTSMIVERKMEAETPHIEAFVTFPDGVIDTDADIGTWEVSAALINHNGGATEVDADYILYFEDLFRHLEEKYGQPST